MGDENVMSKIICVFAVLTFAAHAECLITSGFRADSRNLAIPGQLENPEGYLTATTGWPTDIRTTVTPYGAGRYVCTAIFRIQVNGTWMDARGQAFGLKTDGIDNICKQAVEIKRAEIMVSSGAVPIQSETQMTCTDQPMYRVRKVQVGELIFASEVNVISGFKTIELSGVQYQYFREQIGSRQLTGVMRRVEPGQNGRWQVVDKY